MTENNPSIETEFIKLKEEKKRIEFKEQDIEDDKKWFYFKCGRRGNYRVFLYYKNKPYLMMGPECKIRILFKGIGFLGA